MKIRINKNIFNLESLLFLFLVCLFLFDKITITDNKEIVYGFLSFTYFIYVLKYFKKLIRLLSSNRFFLVYIIFVIVLLFYGLILNNYNSYVLVDFFSFSSFLMILICFKNKKIIIFYTNIFPKLGVYINLISILFVIYYLFNYELTFASILVGRNLEIIDDGQLMSPKYLLYGSLFLYPLVVYLKSRTERLIYHFSIFLFLLFSLAMASRGTVVIGIITIVLTHLHANGIRFNIKAVLNFKFIKYFFLLIILFLILYQNPVIGSATDYLIYRFTEEQTGELRSQEAQAIYDNLSSFELIFGKGLGAANSYWIFNQTPNGVNNTHFGWMFLILKGGLIFLTFIYGKIILSIISLIKHTLLVPYAFLLITFLLLEASHTNFNSFYRLIFLFISISAASNITKINEK
jgi:hypothetical protein